MENNQDQNQNQPQPIDTTNDLETLESQSTVVTEGVSPQAQSSTQNSNNQTDNSKKKKRNPIKGLAGKFNIYLLGFFLVILLAGIVSFVSYQKSKEAAKKDGDLSTESLSQEDLDKLRQTDVKVGDPKQVLSVESNAIFAGKVLIRDSLEVAGLLKVGGPLSLPGLTVSGLSTLDQATVNTLQVGGNAAVQGTLNVQNNAAISGSLTVGGTISAGRLNIETLAINQDLQINRHIDAGGGTPGKADGGALGAGGTSSVSGTDTAGSVVINTGGGTAAGCFVTISFAQRFNGTPHVVITPVGSAAGSLNYYINRSSTNFSICTNNAAPVGQNFGFDYIVID